MRKIVSLLAAMLFFTAAHAQSGKVYEGELSIGGLVYRDNSFAMIETVHGRRFSPTFFLGGGVRTTYHGQQITSEEVQRKLNTAGLAAFADVKLYITPDRRFCPYLNLQGGVQGMMEWPGGGGHSHGYVRPMVGGGIGCVHRRVVFGVYVAVNFESSEGGIKVGLRF